MNLDSGSKSERLDSSWLYCMPKDRLEMSYFNVLAPTWASLLDAAGSTGRETKRRKRAQDGFQRCLSPGRDPLSHIQEPQWGFIAQNRAVPKGKECSVALAKPHGVNVQAKRTLRNHLFQGSTNFSCKGPDCKYFRFCGPYSLCCKSQLCPCNAKAATDNM